MQEEHSALRESSAGIQAQLSDWIERAARAETRLDELTRKKKKDAK